jgi:hypothetical protein
MKKISIDDLIKRNIDKTKVETFEIKINELDGVIKCQTLPESEVLELMEQITKSDTSDLKQMMKFTNKIIYDCVIEPNLKDEKLQKHYEIKGEPYEIVSRIFTMQEINALDKLITEKLGLSDNKGEVIELIKKQ